MVLYTKAGAEASLALSANSSRVSQQPLRHHLTEQAAHWVHQANPSIVIACCFIPLLVKREEEHTIQLGRVPILNKRVEKGGHDLPQVPRLVPLQKLNGVSR